MKFHPFILVLLIMKIGFTLCILAEIYLKIKGSKSKFDDKLTLWKNRFEVVFIAMMCVLLFYLFNPLKHREIKVEHETKLLICVFAVIIVIRLFH